MAKNPTLRDIAAKADVALSTVSQVLNNRANVSAETRDRVLRAASELGYRQKVFTNAQLIPEISTVGLLTKRHNNQPLIVNPFYSYIIAGVERECQRHNMNLMYANVEVDERNHTQTWPAMLLNEAVDGVIVLGAFLEEAIADISSRAKSSIVLVDAYTAQESGFDSVVIDNFNGAASAVSHLIQNGHRQIGLIGSSPDSYPSVLERRRGYLSALAQHSIHETYVEEGALSRVDGFEAALRLLRRHPQITAIFACNDETALGVMSGARELGYRMPEDLSIVGFDDIDLAQEVVPALTTVHVDKVLMGTMALRLLRDRHSDPDRSSITAVVATQLILRDSVRKIGD
ncbi:MAG: LacI family transcriptional regulator [Anaerolineae bacterium]|nr:LacI family transcriptional regulator [Anaerolineae bacterium]NUQ03105.1 LacI family DNA-binding transcriptional regulator [Anaerolineae bacterium]